MPLSHNVNPRDGAQDITNAFAFDGVRRPGHYSRARGPTGAEAATVRALAVYRPPWPPLHPQKNARANSSANLRLDSDNAFICGQNPPPPLQHGLVSLVRARSKRS
jgi:hypothetical protein